MKINSLNADFQPSFKANLVVSRGAKNLMKYYLCDMYMKSNSATKERFFGKRQFNFAKILKRYRSSVESATKKVDGTIKLILNDKYKFGAELVFKASDGKRYSSLNNNLITIKPYEIIQDDLSDRGKPMRFAVSNMMAGLGDLFESHGYREDSNNPFLALLKKHR